MKLKFVNSYLDFSLNGTLPHNLIVHFYGGFSFHVYVEGSCFNSETFKSNLAENHIKHLTY